MLAQPVVVGSFEKHPHFSGSELFGWPATVEPVAEKLNVEIEQRAEVGEGAPVEGVVRLLRDAAGSTVVWCTHGDIVPVVLEAVAAEYRPNFLCNYLYDLAGHFTRFYENCPVLKAAEPERATRMELCDLTARVLKQGLEVLGLETTERM